KNGRTILCTRWCRRCSFLAALGGKCLESSGRERHPGFGRSIRDQSQCRWQSVRSPPPRCCRATWSCCGRVLVRCLDWPSTKNNRSWFAGCTRGIHHRSQKDEALRPTCRKEG